MNLKYKSCIEQLVQIPQFVVAAIGKGCVGRLNVEADQLTGDGFKSKRKKGHHGFILIPACICENICRKASDLRSSRAVDVRSGSQPLAL